MTAMAMTLRPARPVTDDELLTLSERHPGYQFERTAQGELIVTPTGSESGRRNLRLAQQLGNWTDRDGTGVAFDSSTGFRLPDGAVHAPDASWVRLIVGRRSQGSSVDGLRRCARMRCLSFN